MTFFQDSKKVSLQYNKSLQPLPQILLTNIFIAHTLIHMHARTHRYLCAHAHAHTHVRTHTHTQRGEGVQDNTYCLNEAMAENSKLNT